MNFFQKLLNLFLFPASAPDDYSYRFTVQCHRCGEQIVGRVDLRNDLSPEYDGGDTPSAYTCRKVLIGSGANHCFQQIEASFKFSASKKMLEQTMIGGKLLEEQKGR
jgi:hypothetical protein